MKSPAAADCLCLISEHQDSISAAPGMQVEIPGFFWRWLARVLRQAARDRVEAGTPTFPETADRRDLVAAHREDW
jgi:hypothetical protein